jgi:hypothetical protein
MLYEYSPNLQYPLQNANDLLDLFYRIVMYERDPDDPVTFRFGQPRIPFLRCVSLFRSCRFLLKRETRQDARGVEMTVLDSDLDAKIGAVCQYNSHLFDR